MNTQIKICPRCEQGYLYHAKPRYIQEEIILCDECDAVWLKNMKIDYGEDEKDFYVYQSFMESRGVTGKDIWEGELFDYPYYEYEQSKS